MRRLKDIEREMVNDLIDHTIKAHTAEKALLMALSKDEEIISKSEICKNARKNLFTLYEGMLLNDELKYLHPLLIKADRECISRATFIYNLKDILKGEAQ